MPSISLTPTSGVLICTPRTRLSLRNSLRPHATTGPRRFHRTARESHLHRPDLTAEIWVCDVDGSNPVQLTSLRGEPVGGGPQWSWDSHSIAFWTQKKES